MYRWAKDCAVGMLVCRFLMVWVLIVFFGWLVLPSPTFATTLSISTSGAVDIAVDTGVNVGVSNIKVTTDCRFGYTLSIASSVADARLYKDGDSTNTEYISPVTGTSANPAPILNQNGAPNTTWGYSLTSKTGEGKFIGLTGSKVSLLRREEASLNEGDDISIYYGVSAIHNLPAGTYKMMDDGAIVYYLTTNQLNCEVYNIMYDGNNADTGLATSLEHRSVMPNDNVSLYASNYKRDGYGFLGWSTIQIDPDSINAAEQIKNAVIYGPEETIVVDSNVTAVADSNDRIVLYAVWVKSSGDFQSWQGCDDMNVGDVTALTDVRDGNVYAIAKLADDKCWMVENLRLGGGTEITLTPDDTNISSDFVLPASSGSFEAVNNTTAWINVDNVTLAQEDAATMNGNIYSYGGYYSWPAAIADTTMHQGGEDVASSICPKGWRLPAGGAGREFSVLDIALGGNGLRQGAEASKRWRTYPNNFIYSGGWYAKRAVNRDTYGYYSSSTSYSPQRAYYLYLARTFLNPDSDESDMQYVTTVRCVTSSRYTVFFEPNGGSGGMGHQTAQVGEVFTLNDSTFTPPPGRRFAEWNTVPDGSGVSYAAGQSVMNLAGKSGTATLYAQWEKAPSPGYVVYDGNKNTSAFETDSQSASGTNVTLLAANYKRNGYGFAGWSPEKLDPDAVDFSDKLSTIVNGNKIYGPNQTVPSSEVSGQLFYAVWVKPTGDMQGWQGCDDMNVGDITALNDIRDDNTYAVAKLADERCWMIENLRLGSDTKIELTPANTAVFSDLTLPASTNAFSPSNNTTIWINASSMLTPQSNTTSASQAAYTYGGYYSWPAAIADTNLHTVMENVSTSICPKGWHIPTGGAGGEFSTLDIALGGTGTSQTTLEASNRYRVYPNNFVFGGGWGGYAVNRGAYGYYATSTSEKSGYAYYFYLLNSAVHPDSNSEATNKYVTTARCIADSV